MGGFGLQTTGVTDGRTARPLMSPLDENRDPRASLKVSADFAWERRRISVLPRVPAATMTIGAVTWWWLSLRRSA
jgi:hypothetical protein